VKDDRVVLVYHDEKLVMASPLHTLQARLQRDYYTGEMVRRRLVGDPRHLSFYRHIGVETFGGKPHDVWQGDVPMLDGGGTQSVRARLRAGTNEFNKLESYNDDGSIRETYEVLARDAEIPEERFELDPPQEYKPLADRDLNAAKQQLLFGMADGGFQVNFAFRLPDGSVLLAWRDGANGDELQRVLDGLASGDPFVDQYPIPVGPLSTVGLPTEVEFAAHHLTYTRDELGICAWSLYVPNRPIAARDQFLGYALTKTNAWEWRAGEVVHHSAEVPIAFDISVDDREEYETVVLTVMRHYATRQPDRSFPEYEAVTELTERMRKALGDD
jgi:hypothetical protein